MSVYGTGEHFLQGQRPPELQQWKRAEAEANAGGAVGGSGVTPRSEGPGAPEAGAAQWAVLWAKPTVTLVLSQDGG